MICEHRYTSALEIRCRRIDGIREKVVEMQDEKQTDLDSLTSWLEGAFPSIVDVAGLIERNESRRRHCKTRVDTLDRVIDLIDGEDPK